MKTLLLIAAMLIVGTDSAYGQSAVAVCQLTGVYTYCSNDDNPGECARVKCLEQGGKVPNVIMSTVQKGYGAIAMGFGDGNRPIFGASGGHNDSRTANMEALNECRRRGGQMANIVEYWNDME